MGHTKRHLRIIEQTQREMAAREREVDRLIRSRFATSCMSNAKWRRAFDVVADHAATVACCRWKFVDGDRLWESTLPKCGDPEGGYFESPFGIVVLKHLEWVEIVTSAPEGIMTALAQRGQLAMERTAEGLRLFGYR